MQQAKKLSLDTIVRQQETLILKLEKEQKELENALEDKKFQLALQKEVLETLRGTK